MPHPYISPLQLLSRKVLPEIADAFDVGTISVQQAVAILEVFGVSEKQRVEWLEFGNQGKSMKCGNSNCNEVHIYHRRDLVMGGE